jgi:hypothetical protein
MIRKEPYLPVLLLAVFFIGTTTLHAQDEKFKAIFIYNFTKYVSWPVKQGNFTIVILGNDAITPALEDIASKKTVGTTQIEVRNARTPADIGNCHILYIPPGKSDMLPQVTSKAKENGILVVTEKQDACSQGSCINFVNSGGKITFEISRPNIENNGLKVSGDLVHLGISKN